MPVEPDNTISNASNATPVRSSASGSTAHLFGSLGVRDEKPSSPESVDDITDENGLVYGQIPREEFLELMAEQAQFLSEKNRIDHALSDIELCDIQYVNSDMKIMIDYDPRKHGNEAALRALISQKLPDVDFSLRKLTPEKIEERGMTCAHF